MNGKSIKVQSIGWGDMLAVTRMTFDNMIGVDRYFTQMVRNPLGHWLTYATMPLYLRFSGKGYKVLVDGRIAACGFLHMRSHSGYIFNISVNKPYRRQGYGRRLMAYLERVIGRQGIGWAALQVDYGNEPAEQLYRKLGYQAYHPRFLRRDHRPPIGRAATAGVALQRLGHWQGQDLYRRCQNIERQKGDLWAASVVDEYDTWSEQRGVFWRCQLYQREIGCAQLVDRDGQPLIRLALEPEYWGHVATGGVVQELVDSVPGRPAYVDLFLESSAHHRAAAPLLEELGFQERLRLRKLMLKALDEKTETRQ
jgi:GNAT superfamily N-acetyltransferase